MEQISSVILCGGQSRRMGQDKARLVWEQKELLDVIAGALSELGEVFLSVDNNERLTDKPFPKVVDQYSGCGPLGGIYSALLGCKTSLLFVVSCDMPFVTAQVGAKLQTYIEGNVKAAVPRELSGRAHPLCAVYHRDTASRLQQQLESGCYRVQDSLERLNTKYVPAQELPGGERILININTPEEYLAHSSKNFDMIPSQSTGIR